jgi:preprotein translocase subunit YajC
MSDTAGALLPLLLLALAFIVLIVLPMRNRSRQLQQTRRLQAMLTVGTEVMTTSGLYGRIVGLGDDTVELEVSPGVVVRWARAAIAEVRGSSTDQPAADGEPGPPAQANGEPDPV